MIDWVIRIGMLMAITGAILLSPLADLLPVDSWYSIKNLFQSDSSAKFVRIVVAERNRTLEFTLIGVGLVLVAVGFYLKSAK